MPTAPRNPRDAQILELGVPAVWCTHRPVMGTVLGTIAVLWMLSFIVNRPKEEPGFRLVRTEEPGRTLRYSIESYATQSRPEGMRYSSDN